MTVYSKTGDHLHGRLPVGNQDSEQWPLRPFEQKRRRGNVRDRTSHDTRDNGTPRGVKKGKALSRHSGVQRFALLRSGHNSTGRFEKKVAYLF